MHLFDLLHCDLIVPADRHLAAQFPQILHQVIGERIVIIDNQYHLCSQQLTSFLELVFRVEQALSAALEIAI
jgi:hypothetical protein